MMDAEINERIEHEFFGWESGHYDIRDFVHHDGFAVTLLQALGQHGMYADVQVRGGAVCVSIFSDHSAGESFTGRPQASFSRAVATTCVAALRASFSRAVATTCVAALP